MKIVVFIRHAKSSWEYPELADWQRPVAKRGLSDIMTIASALKRREIIPDLVLCSTALRAKQTALGLLQQLQSHTEVQYTGQLYFECENAIYNEIRKTKPQVNTLFVVSHNPDINAIVLDDLGVQADNIPTLGCVLCTTNTGSWANWQIADTKVFEVLMPKKLH
ncbi:histidine phosphatase family protein [bacterium]|nr:histidine phosphatase family protein [bacterium]